MKKILSTIAISTFLLPNIFLANVSAEETESNKINIEYESMTLMKEKYDGANLIRYYQYDDSKRQYIQFIEVPIFIQKEINKNSKNSVGSVISTLASYYSNKEINNVEKLNELFYQFVPETPGSKISFSDKYSESAAKNLFLALESKLDTTSFNKEEKEILKTVFVDEKFTKEFAPYHSKTDLYKATEKLAEELDVKWYETITFYISVGILFILAIGLFIIIKRR